MDDSRRVVHNIEERNLREGPKRAPTPEYDSKSRIRACIRATARTVRRIQSWACSPNSLSYSCCSSRTNPVILRSGDCRSCDAMQANCFSSRLAFFQNLIWDRKLLRTLIDGCHQNCELFIWATRLLLDLRGVEHYLLTLLHPIMNECRKG